jgi:hypothetical protein
VLQLVGGIAVHAVGFFLWGLACVLGVAAAFYAVGSSEDRERGARDGRDGE